MNDNDGLIKPRPVLFGTDITDPTEVRYDVNGQVAVTPRHQEYIYDKVVGGTQYGRFDPDLPDPRTLVEDYEITAAYDGDLTGMPVSHILAWIAILTLIGLAMYSIVWGI